MNKGHMDEYKKILYLFLALITLFFIKDTAGQGFFSNDRKNEKMKTADKNFKNGKYYRAYYTYKKLYKKDSNNAELNYKMGATLMELKKNIEKAHNFLKKAKEKEEKGANYYLGRYYHLKEAFENAIKSYYRYLDNDNENIIPEHKVKRSIEISKRAKKMIKNSKDIAIHNIGETVNSRYSEYVPLISGDGSELYFTSRRKNSTGQKTDPNGNYFEDIYRAVKKEGKWQTPHKLRKGINTSTHDATVALSQSGNMLLIYRTNEEITGGDILKCERTKENWSEPKKLGDFINTKNQEASATMTLDEKTIYFSSNRKGGNGKKDIYKSKKLPNGKWSKAKNLESKVNTSYEEDGPFITGNNNTLYFSSNGHNTMGGYDIYKTTLKKNGEWSQPKNLGHPINTVKDDIYLTMTADGNKAYYSSDKKGGYG
ncbi:MAG: TolB family protein, partial [Flavobacteriales bacterium]